MTLDYRAHDQINLFMSSLCPTEQIPTEKEQIVPKPQEEVAQNKKISKKKKKKDIPEESEETKAYGQGVNATKNKCK